MEDNSKLNYAIDITEIISELKELRIIVDKLKNHDTENYQKKPLSSIENEKKIRKIENKLEKDEKKAKSVEINSEECNSEVDKSEENKSEEDESEESKHYDEISKVIEHTTTKIITNKKKLIQDSFDNPVRYKNSKPQINKNLSKSINSIVSREIDQMLEESKLVFEPDVQDLKNIKYEHKNKERSSDNIFKD